MNTDVIIDWKSVALLVVLIIVDVCLLLPIKRRKKRVVSDVTVQIPALYLDMLDPRNHKRVVGTYSLSKEQLATNGLSISRTNRAGDIIMDCIFEETETVGSNHAVVAKDDQGYFIQCEHQNGMSLYVNEDEQIEMDEIAIKENQIIFLGRQPICFRMSRINNPKSSRSFKKYWKLFRFLGGEILSHFPKKDRSTKNKWKNKKDWY